MILDFYYVSFNTLYRDIVQRCELFIFFRGVLLLFVFKHSFSVS